MSRLAAAVLALVGAVALLVVQTNVPWAERSSGNEQTTARTWGETSSGNGFLFSYSGAKGWYDSGWSDQDRNAVQQLQIAAPLLLAGLALLLVGSVLAFSGPGSSGAGVALVGGLVAAGATVLYYLAIQDLFDNNASWQGGFTLAIAGCVLGLAGGVVGMATGSRRSTLD
jgi:hypothetical protein